jgi:hypothetical protein
MKNKIITIVTMLFVTAVLLNSCTDEANAPFNGPGTPAAITVESAGEASATAFSVAITPSANAVAYTFAIGTPSDYALFVSRSGTLKTIKEVIGNKDTVVTFEELSPGAEYAVFAQACTAEGYRSEVTTFTVPTKSASVSVRFDEITTIYAVVATEMHGDIGKYFAIAASKEVYYDYLALYGLFGYSEEEFLESVGYEYYKNDTTAWLLGGPTDYEYIFVVLPYATDGTPLSITKTEFSSPAFIPGLPLPRPGTIKVSDSTDNTVRIAITPHKETTFGYYAGCVKAAAYDTLSADEIHAVWYEELPFYFTPSFEPANDIWEGFEPGTEYVVGVVPFNLNGADGYGPVYTERFKTTGTPVPPSPVPAPGSIGSKRLHGNEFILPDGQAKPYKKFLPKKPQQ